MAKKIKLNKINGKDTLANSITTLNQNFELLEDTLETQITHGISSLQVKDVVWNTSGVNGPSSNITLTNGNSAKINPIPSADESQSGVITTGDQVIAGVKTFKQGIVTDSIVDKKNHNIVIADGNTVYVGGNGGIKLTYDGEGNLTDVEYGFLRGVDLSQIINNNNTSARSIEELRNYLNSVMNDYNSRFESQEDSITSIATSIAELNLDDLINQNDGMVENYFGNPEEMQELLTEWAGHEEDHIGDTFTDVVNKLCYKFEKYGSSYRWRLLDEEEYSAVVRALLNSLDAKSVADGKCTTFYQDAIPAPCYVGDIWIVKKSFYMNGNNQVDYVEGTTTVPEGTVVYMANSMLFCVKDNDTNVPDITDWNKDLSTWSELQFQKNVETKFEAATAAIEDAQNAINVINDDNTFSVFEKRDFLNNTWYPIAGSYTYNANADVQYQDGKPTTKPKDGFLGSGANGTFWGAVMNCAGDNESISDYNIPLGELIAAYKALAAFCTANGLFNNSVESAPFVTSRTSQVAQNGSNLGAVAKQELSDLLYNYYREEDECKKTAYVAAVTSSLGDLIDQADHKIQNWYLNSVPTTQAELPWRKEGEDELDYTANDENHIDDTCTNLSSTLSQSIYKFSKFNNVDELEQNDIGVLNTNFYWRNINSADVQTIINDLDIDTYLASLDGSINVFNSTPTNYTYGDIWFFNGFAQDDPNHSHLSPQDKALFTEGCIYYCSNTSLDGNETNGIRATLVASDWANGYSKGNEFITRFANMASDSCLTPIEKNQLVRTFYEISGTNLYGNDNDANNDIIKDIFDDNNSNDGSLRFVINDCVETLTGDSITNHDDYLSFINGEGSDSEYDDAVELVENLVKKFLDIKTALISCGCLATDVDTDLTQVTFSGFQNLTKYNGVWKSDVHITMLSDVFTTYYMEEDNLKTFIQQVKVNIVSNDLRKDIVNVRNVSMAAKDAAGAANNAIADLNSDSVFTISEKMSFLNSTWLKIAGSKTFDPTANALDAQGHPGAGYLGTTSKGSFYLLVKDLDLNQYTDIVTKFTTLGTICNHFGLFNDPLQQSNFGTGEGTDYDADDLYDALFEYYNEEELMRKNVYAASVNETLDALKNQIDGKISTFYGEGLPPSTQQGLSAYWEDANENHINDEYKDIRSIDNGGGKTYIFVVKTSETTITESDVEIDGINYYWKGIDSSNISNIISQLEEAYNNALAEADGAIQIFGEADLPDEYNYGDIWFFGGIDKIQDSNKGNYDLSSFVAGNIYYCEGVYEGSEKGFTTFNPIHWKVGSNAGDTTQRFAHMTSDDWLSVSEKQQLCDEWYKITGIQFSNGYNENNLIQKIESTQPNTGSYYTLVKKYKDNLPNTDDDTPGGGGTPTPGGGDTPTPGGDTPDVPTYDEENCLTNTKYLYLSNTEYKGTPTITQNKSKTTLSFGDENTYIVGYKIVGGDTVKSEDCKTEITFEKDTPSIESVYILSVCSYIKDNLIYPDLNIKYADDKIIITTIDGNYKTIKGYSTNKTSAEDINGESIECSTEGLEYINLYFESTGAVSPFNRTTYFIGGSSIDSKKFKIENNKLTIPDEENMFIVAYTMGGKYIKPDEGCKSITISESDKQVKSVYLFNLVKDESITVYTISSSIIDDKITIIIKIEKGEIKGCEITGLRANEDYSLKIENGTIDITLKTSSLTKLNTINITSSTPSFSGSLDIEETKENLDNALKNLFKILLTCKCHIQEDTDLSTVNWNSTPVSTTPTLLVNLFNRYYAEEKNLSVELTELQITNTIEDPVTVQELAEGVGGRGFVLSSLIQLEYNNAVVGGLDGVTEDGNGGVDNVGMWFGGTVENAKKTLNGTLNGESPVPVVITKNGYNSKIGPFKVGDNTSGNDHVYVGSSESGNVTVIAKDYISMGTTYANSDTKDKAAANAPIYLNRDGFGSKIGPFKVGGSSSNEHIYVGNSVSGNVTVIGKDYISMGATYANSNTKENAQQNSMIYLDKDGEGSRIGPLKIKKDSNNKILTFGNTTQVYSFKNTNSYTASFGTRTEKIIDGHTFSDNELNKSIQYGTSIVDFDNITIINMDTNPGDETLLPDFDGLDKP